MNLRLQPSASERAFTLVEMLIAGVVAGVMLTAVVVGGATFQRVFAASDGSLKAAVDQSRILDYIIRDLRRALTVTVSNGGKTLAVTIPDYIDSGTGLPRIPTVKPGTSNFGIPNGVVDYGDPAAPVTITYFPANDPVSPSTTYTYTLNGKYLVRQMGAVQTVISRDCTSLQVNFTDNTTSVTTSISFAPRFNLLALADARTAVTVYATTVLRNNRR